MKISFGLLLLLLLFVVIFCADIQSCTETSVLPYNGGNGESSTTDDDDDDEEEDSCRYDGTTFGENLD